MGQKTGKLRAVVPSLIDDLAQLVTEITRLHSALVRERLISANLRAAIRAALGAQSDGEPDPLAHWHSVRTAKRPACGFAAAGGAGAAAS